MENNKETSCEIEAVKKYIDEHFDTTITIQYLAKLVFVSSSKLKKDFRITFGSTLHEFLLH